MKKINESFTCIHCGQEVQEAQKTCRNHCPYCFASLHVDGEIPGDRKATCQGIMYPLAYEIKNGGLKILLQCQRCGKRHRNKRAKDDEVVTLDEAIHRYRHFFE